MGDPKITYKHEAVNKKYVKPIVHGAVCQAIYVARGQHKLGEITYAELQAKIEAILQLEDLLKYRLFEELTEILRKLDNQEEL